MKDRINQQLAEGASARKQSRARLTAPLQKLKRNLVGRANIIHRKLSRTPTFKISKVAAILGAIFFTLYFITRLNIFFIEDIEITTLEGTPFEYISESSVEESLIDYIGVRLFSLDTEIVEKKVRSEVPFAKEVYVTKRFPDTLVVRITERDPAIKISQLNNAKSNEVILDEEGNVLDSCLSFPETCKQLPLCQIESDPSEFELGSNPYLPEVLDALEISEIFTYAGEEYGDVTVSKYFVPESEVIVADLGGTRAIFSGEKDLVEQAQDFLDTRKGLIENSRPYKEIDLRYDRPVVR